MSRRPPRFTRTDTLVPCPPLFLSHFKGRCERNPRRLGLGKQGRLLHRRIDYRTRDRSGQSAALDPERVGDGAIKADVPRHFIGEHGEATRRSEERRVGKELSVRVDLGGRRIIKKKKNKQHKMDTMKDSIRSPYRQQTNGR